MSNESKSKFANISEDIVRRIRNGELRPGDKVPSENEIISIYKVSNTTARKALLDIELKGWVKRIKGKGTFVLNRTEEKRLIRTLGSIGDTRVGFHEKLRAEGLLPRSIVLEKSILEEGVSMAVGGKHYIIDGPVLKIHLLRYANELVMKDETKFISLTLCPKIHHLPTEVSHYKAYEEKYHLSVAALNQTLGCMIFEPDRNDNNFEVSHPIPVFVLNSAVVTSMEKVVELEHSFYRGDKYQFAIQAHPDW